MSTGGCPPRYSLPCSSCLARPSLTYPHSSSIPSLPPPLPQDFYEESPEVFAMDDAEVRELLPACLRFLERVAPVIRGSMQLCICSTCSELMPCWLDCACMKCIS